MLTKKEAAVTVIVAIILAFLFTFPDTQETRPSITRFVGWTGPVRSFLQMIPVQWFRPSL